MFTFDSPFIIIFASHSTLHNFRSCYSIVKEPEKQTNIILNTKVNAVTWCACGNGSVIAAQIIPELVWNTKIILK